MKEPKEDPLAKFYPMEEMADREFVLYGVTIISRALQSVLDEWLPIFEGTPDYYIIDDPYWDLVSNVRLCEAMQMIDQELIDDLAIVTQIAGLYASKTKSRLAGKQTTELVNRLRVLGALDTVAAAGDSAEAHIAILQMNLDSTRDRYRMAARMLDSNLRKIASNASLTPFRRFNSASTSVPAELPEVDNVYRSALGEYERALKGAIDFSRIASNRPSETASIFWASLLFTRLCTFGVSIAKLTPGSTYSHRKVDPMWDNSSVSTLARATFECFLLFFYLGVDGVPEDEWAARQDLMYLHDANMRLRVFHHAETDDAERVFYTEQREVLAQRLQRNRYFQSLPDRRRAHLLRGRDLFFTTQDEIIAQIGWDQAEVRRFYEFLSAHVHSLPVAFYKAMEDGRGRGVENDPEKAYLAQTLAFLASLITSATELYRSVSEPYLSKTE